MTDAPKKSSRIWEFLLIFALAYLLSEFVIGYFRPKQPPPTEQHTTILEPTAGSYRSGHHPIITMQNNTAQQLTLPDRCPMPPLDVFRVEAAGTGAVKSLQTNETAIPCEVLPPVAPGGQAQISLAPWKYSLFGEAGTYEVRFPPEVRAGTGAAVRARFSMHEPGVIVKTFRAFITKPFLNFLVFIASVLPDHNLGIAIIVLTLLVKLLLYFPTQHAMEGQRKMQLIQPKIQELQKKYKGEPQKLHEETLKLWRQEGVNPFQSILPILLQFPILIGLFYVIRDGSHLSLSREFLYALYRDLPWTFGTSLFRLDLTQPNWVMPPLLVGLQFLQMKLSFAAAKKKQTQPADKSQQMQQKMMQYTMPLLIGFFAIQFPAAVSLYWAVSTVFAIGQQILVNRKTG